MTSLAHALSTKPQVLSPFEGRDVLNAAVEIPGASGGLREPMQFEPQEFHYGEEVTVVLRCKVRKVRFDPIKETDCHSRVHILEVVEGTFIDYEMVEEALRSQRERIALFKEEAAGVTRLPFDSELHDAHESGLHTEWVGECVDCANEREAQEAGE